MAITANNTTLTFNDATTQTTSGVTSIGVSTGISSTGGKTPTLTNTGVTSVAAGTGITVSASTGGVTITNSQPGAVSSVNGATGAVVTTNIDSIGATIMAVVAATGGGGTYNTTSTQNSTYAGSSIRYSYSVGGSGVPPIATMSSLNSGNFYAAGGTAPSGTWRAVGRSSGGVFDGCNNTTTCTPNMFVRIS